MGMLQRPTGQQHSQVDAFLVPKETAAEVDKRLPNV
jgi:hypothetical protein